MKLQSRFFEKMKTLFGNDANSHYFPVDPLESLHLLLFSEKWKKTETSKRPDKINIVRRDMFVTNRILQVDCLNDNAIKQMGYYITSPNTPDLLSKILEETDMDIIIKSKIYDDTIDKYCNDRIMLTREKCITHIKNDKQELISNIGYFLLQNGFDNYTTLLGKDNKHLFIHITKEFLNRAIEIQKDKINFQINNLVSEINNLHMKNIGGQQDKFEIERNNKIIKENELKIENLFNDDNLFQTDIALIRFINKKWGNGKCSFENLYKYMGGDSGKKYNRIKYNRKKYNMKKYNRKRTIKKSKRKTTNKRTTNKRKTNRKKTN